MKRVPLAASVLLATALAACGGGGGGAGAGAPGSALNGEQTKTGQQVLADAKRALFDARSVHFSGRPSGKGRNGAFELDLEGNDVRGTVNASGAILRLVKAGGQVYFNAPARYWSRVSAQAARRLADRWVFAPAERSPQVSRFTLQGIAATLNADDSPLKPGVRQAALDGRKVVVVTQQNGSELFLSNTGAPLPVRIVNRGASKETESFTGYGRHFAITAPPGAVPIQTALRGGSPQT